MSQKEQEQVNSEEEKEESLVCENSCDEQSQTQNEPQVDEKNCEDLLKEAEEKYIRAYADFENIKKRLEKDKQMAIDYASESFARDLLPVVDALEMALSSNLTDSAQVLEKLKEGVSLTKDNLIKTFEKHGIEVISHDDGFDPHFHEAVMQVPSQEHDENSIVQILQKGYVYKKRVIRPSMVSICKK